MKVKEDHDTKIMASDPIMSGQIDGETLERVADYFGGSKITADGRWLQPWD